MKLIIYLGRPTVQNRRVWSILWNSLQCRRVWSPSHGARRGQIASINNPPGSHWILLGNFVCWVDQRSTITLGGVGLALEMEGQDLTSPDQINAYFDCSHSRIRGALLFKCHKPRRWFTKKGGIPHVKFLDDSHFDSSICSLSVC
jgi:hypothetical protein